MRFEQLLSTKGYLTFKQSIKVLISLIIFTASQVSFASSDISISINEVVNTKKAKLGTKYQVRVGDSIINLDFKDEKIKDQLSHIKFESKRNPSDYTLNGHFSLVKNKLVLKTTKIKIIDPDIVL